jgi:adenine-specific DNA-methyltransferase
MPTLHFKGKSFVENHHLTVPYHQLIPDEAASLTDKISLNDNLIIHGDNLKALKALLPNYQGKVKCIYIDPPYNTGSQEEAWRYNDNVNSPMIQDWLNQNKPIDQEDLTRHDKWLCMMMPRLTLLRELLRDDGVIFISIDDNEVHHLRMLMDEIFGDNNFLALLIRQTKSGGGSAAESFAVEHDYLLVYARNKEMSPKLYISYSHKYLERYKEEDSEGKFYWDTLQRSYTQTRPYPITAPDGQQLEGSWFVGQDTFEAMVERGDIRFRKKRDDSWSVQFKQRLPSGKKIRSILQDKEFQSGQSDLSDLGLAGAIPYPKPVALIKAIAEATLNNDDIILDSFAGSGTTAHAVLALNAQDDGNRRFILIEMEDYADSLTAERVRRVIQGVPDANDETLQAGLPGTLSFFNLGETIDIEAVFSGDPALMPTYADLARYLFYTSTGEEFVPENLDEANAYIGESQRYHVYLFYQPDVKYLQNTALTLDMIRDLPMIGGKERLVFAPMHYVDSEYLHQHKVRFVRLPFEIYRYLSN